MEETSRGNKGKVEFLPLSFHARVQIPDVLLNTLCFILIGPRGAAPSNTHPPICSPGGQSDPSLPALRATWASCLQVSARTSPGTGAADPAVSSESVPVIGGGEVESQVSTHRQQRKLIQKPQERRLQRHLEDCWEEKLRRSRR